MVLQVCSISDRETPSARFFSFFPAAGISRIAYGDPPSGRQTSVVCVKFCKIGHECWSCGLTHTNAIGTRALLIDRTGIMPPIR